MIKDRLFIKRKKIVKVIDEYFQGLFTSLESPYQHTESIVHSALHPLITIETNQKLIQIPTSLEVKEAMFFIHVEKALGPDGFSASFFQTNWEIIGHDIVKEVQDFFQTESMPRAINETHIRLIPKINGPTKVSDYRPITLCNVNCKVITKIITSRLQPIMDALISENQSTFVPQREISDNAMKSCNSLKPQKQKNNAQWPSNQI